MMTGMEELAVDQVIPWPVAQAARLLFSCKEQAGRLHHGG
jgi:hypothetical protein